MKNLAKIPLQFANIVQPILPALSSYIISKLSKIKYEN